MFLGSRDETAHIGYVSGRCPRCAAEGYLAVYESRRKLTLHVLVALPVGEQVVVECRKCGGKFAVPKDERQMLQERMISADDLVLMANRAAATVIGNSQITTYYRLLQVDPEADPEVIEAAFKRLAFKFHPDRSPGIDSETKMRNLLEARAVLTDERRRAAYDRTLGFEVKAKLPDAMRSDDI